jgi:hypothetical protein
MPSTFIYFALKEAAAPFRKIAAGKAAQVPAGISILLTGLDLIKLMAEGKNVGN